MDPRSIRCSESAEHEFHKLLFKKAWNEVY